MDGTTCVVTGSTSGIGKEVTRSLVRSGARVVMVARDAARAEGVRAEIARDAAGTAEIAIADLASLGSVRALAADLLERCPRIDVLVSNAGVFRTRRVTTPDGYEETFAVNHLAPFLLVTLLEERLRASTPARVVVVASDAHHGARLDLDDLMLERNWGMWRAYSRSKLANVMFTYALARRLEGSGVTANACHPGFVASRLGSGNGIPVGWFYALARPFARSPRRGARTAVWLATAPSIEGVTGTYFKDERPHRAGRSATDEAMQDRLWDASAALV